MARYHSGTPISRPLPLSTPPERLQGPPTGKGRVYRRWHAVALTGSELRTAADRAEAAVEDDDEKAVREQDAARQGAAWLRSYRERLHFHVQQVSDLLVATGWPRERAQADLSPGAPAPPDGRWDGLVAWLKEFLYTGNRLRDNERLILFTEYRDTQRYLLWRLREVLRLDGPAVLALFGGAGLDLREAIKAQFNDPESPLRILEFLLTPVYLNRPPALIFCVRLDDARALRQGISTWASKF